MKYFLVAGEASGDLHAAGLMRALLAKDAGAEFRYFGGDAMRAVGGVCVRHIREMAYMGFGPVVRHLPQILGLRREARREVAAWRPDAVVLVDYGGFNLDLARYVHRHHLAPVHYYISPKIWAWQEGRIRRIRRDVDHMYCILPFEKDFYERRHGYKVDYVGNPTVAECSAGGGGFRLVEGRTFALLAHPATRAALVCSGTATLETALLGVPQVVCYATAVPRLMRWGFEHLVRVPYISLVNLIAGREVVPELFADRFQPALIRRALAALLPDDSAARTDMLRGYNEIRRRLGTQSAPETAAGMIVERLRLG